MESLYLASVQLKLWTWERETKGSRFRTKRVNCVQKEWSKYELTINLKLEQENVNWK